MPSPMSSDDEDEIIVVCMKQIRREIGRSQVEKIPCQFGEICGPHGETAQNGNYEVKLVSLDWHGIHCTGGAVHHVGTLGK